MRNDTLLPLGVECDSCNSYASKLENSFMHHNRIWVPIMLHRIPGKGGKLRKKIGHYRANEEKEIITVTFKENWIINEDGKRKLIFPDPSEFCGLKFRRALYHIAFNYVAWKFGWKSALEQKFDEVRRYVRYPKINEKWPYGQVGYDENNIRKKLEITWLQDAPGLTVRFESYADDFFIDVLNTGKLKEWLSINYDLNYLYHD